MSNEEAKAMRLFDKCLGNQGTHGNLDVHLTSDPMAEDPWKTTLKLYHADGYHWELQREQKFKEGQPAGYHYQFYEPDPETSGFEAVGLDAAYDLIMDELENSENQ